MTRTQTNIELNDEHVATIMDRYNIHTETEAVALALRHLVGQPMTRDEVIAMRGANLIGDVRADPPSA